MSPTGRFIARFQTANEGRLLSAVRWQSTAAHAQRRYGWLYKQASRCVHENLSINVLYTLLRVLQQLREGAWPKLLALAMGSWGLAISEAILGFLDVAPVCRGLLRSLRSPCVTVGLHSSALFAVMVTTYKISAPFIPKPSGHFTHGQSCLNQRRSIPWVQQGVGVRKDH